MKDFLNELDNELNWVENKTWDTNWNNSWEVKKEDINNSIKKEEKQQVETKKKQVSKKTNRNNQNKKRYDDSNNVMWKFVSRFPETKFYLPNLREGYTRYVPIWWNDETWAKNMGMVQYWDDIVLIDCGLQFASWNDMLWANYSIPDVSFLWKYKNNIKGFVVTHAHLDHIWALKHILPAIGMPTLYATKLTIGIIKKWLEEAGILSKMTLIEIDADDTTPIKIWAFDIEFFRVNHSVPDSAWLYIKSPGWVTFMHTWDFKIDLTPRIDKPADLARIWAFGEKGVTMLLSDSTWSIRKGHSKSEEEVWNALDEIVQKHTRWRLIVATFSSWISRVQQLIDSAERYDKTIFLSGRSMLENIAIAKELGYIKMKPGVVKKMTPKNTEWIPPHKQIIITTGSQWEEFSALSRMAEWRHNAVEILKGDTIIFSSSVVPWNEKSVVTIINKLIKLGATVITKDDWEFHTWGHAFQDEQKMMIKLAKPKYLMPIYWDLYFRHIHKQTAMSIWIKQENILLIDNGNIVDFAPKTWNVFKSRIKIPLKQIIIDWYGIWIADSHVIKAREKMMNAWVLVINYKVDKKTKAILWHLKVETRWLAHLEEVRYIHRMIIKKAKESYENTIKDVPDIEEKDLLKIIRTDLEQLILKRTDREPMIIPMITEV